MKITIEPTNKKNGYTTCSISKEGDDITLPDMFDELVIPCLLGMGYAQKNIDDYLDNN